MDAFQEAVDTMLARSTVRSRGARLALISVGLATTGLTILACAILGQDANWDLQNYHLYGPIAWREGRIDLDLQPAHIQTWHNPLLDFPFALLVMAGASGWLVTAWLTLPTLVALLYAARLLRLLQPDARFDAVLGMIALAIGGAAAWPEIGTTFNDWFVAAAIMPALYYSVRGSEGAPRAWPWLVAGLLGGAIAGLKLTAAMYCLGLIAAAIVAAPLRQAPLRLAWLAIGGLSGAAATFGVWAVAVWQRFGNPLFPYFNDVFQSPAAALLPYSDQRFVPGSFLDALLAPWYLLWPNQRYSELTLADPHFFLGLIAAMVIVATALYRSRASAAPSDDCTNLNRTMYVVLAFTATSTIVWLAMYGIYRYALTLEVVFSVICVVAGCRLARGWLRRAVLLVLVVGAMSITDRPHWGRTDFSSPMLKVEYPTSFDRSSIIVAATWQPVAYAAAFLPNDVPLISIYNSLFMGGEVCAGLQAEAWRRVDAHRGDYYWLRPEPEEDFARGRLALFGLYPDGECQPVKGAISPLSLCPLRRGEPSGPMPANTQPVAQPMRCGPLP